jgi:hypothetical protein
LIFFPPLIALITLEQDSYQRFLYGEILPKMKKRKKTKKEYSVIIFSFIGKKSNFGEIYFF